MDGANREVVSSDSNQPRKEFTVTEASGVHDLKELVSDQLEIGTLLQLTNAIIQGFDYDRLVRDFSVEAWVIGDLKAQLLMFSHALRIHNALRNDTAQCLAINSKLVAVLNQYQVALRSAGMLGARNSSQLPHQITTCPMPDFNSVRSQLAQCVRLSKSFRSDAHFVEVQATELVEVLDDLQNNKTASGFDQPGGFLVDERMANAITSGVDLAYKKLPAHDFSFDRTEDLYTAEPVGKQTWDDTTNSLGENALNKLQQDIERLCPARFRKIVERIVFMNLVPDSSATGWHKAGSYLLDGVTGLASIRINLVVFQNKPELMLGVILHEIAHACHDSFPVFLLKIWYDAIAQGRALNVTPYSAKVRQNTPDRFDAEDFAETFRLFCLDPDQLRFLSPQRYQAMRAICAQLQ